MPTDKQRALERAARINDLRRKVDADEARLKAIGGCTCDLQDSPDAPADWHGVDCPLYVKPAPEIADTAITCIVCGKYHSVYRRCW